MTVLSRSSPTLLATMAITCFAAPMASAAPAAEGLHCVVVADDFVPHAAHVVRVDSQSVEYVEDQTENSVTLPLERLVRFERFATHKTKAPSDAASAYWFVLRDGQCVSAKPGKLSGDDLAVSGGREISTDHAARRGTLPIKSVAVIVSAKNGGLGELAREVARRGAAAPQDEVLLNNGDVISGVMSASDDAAVTIQTADGQSVPVDWANVKTLRLAAVGGDTGAAGSPATFRMTLRDGRVIDGSGLTLSDKSSAFDATLGGHFSPLTAEDIVVIEHRGRTRMLANVPPASTTYASFFPSKTAARLPTGTVPTFGGRPMHDSIAAPPHSTMTWPLDGSGKTFLTRYAIAEGRPLADVTVRVKLEDRVVFEKAHVRSGAPSDLLRLPLGDAKSLTLEVDFGDNYDVQDELYWLEPALSPE